MYWTARESEGKEMLAIKKDAIKGANEHNYDTTKYLTMQLRAYNDPLSDKQIERRRKRARRIRRKELIKQIACYTFGSVVMIALWIVVTGY